MPRIRDVGQLSLVLLAAALVACGDGDDPSEPVSEPTPALSAAVDASPSATPTPIDAVPLPSPTATETPVERPPATPEPTPTLTAEQQRAIVTIERVSEAVGYRLTEEETIAVMRACIDFIVVWERMSDALDDGAALAAIQTSLPRYMPSAVPPVVALNNASLHMSTGIDYLLQSLATTTLGNKQAALELALSEFTISSMYREAAGCPAVLDIDTD